MLVGFPLPFLALRCSSRSSPPAQSSRMRCFSVKWCQVETARTRSPNWSGDVWSWSVSVCFTEFRMHGVGSRGIEHSYCQMHCTTLPSALCRQQSSVPFWVGVLQHSIPTAFNFTKKHPLWMHPKVYHTIAEDKTYKIIYVEHSCRFLSLRSWKCCLNKHIAKCQWVNIHPGDMKILRTCHRWFSQELAKRQRKDLWRLCKLVEARPNACNADCKLSNKGKSELKQFKPHRTLRCCKKQ